MSRVMGREIAPQKMLQVAGMLLNGYSQNEIDPCAVRLREENKGSKETMSCVVCRLRHKLPYGASSYAIVVFQIIHG